MTDNQTALDGTAAVPLFARERFAMRSFASTTDALGVARACRDAGVDCRLVPRPAGMGTAECGTALRTRPADEPQVRALLAGAGIEPSACIEVLDYA